jgi:2-amino-4-hydroxy-6-hydroxymethyldihydropteridine diphosphokinase
MNVGIHLLLGTNLGNKRRNLEQAKEKISVVAQILRSSVIYKTQAWGNTRQPDFYNQVVEISTSQTPEILLGEILAIEAEMGRERKEKWGARLIDIDILFFREEILNLPHLTIPHPEIANRKFVLVPLCELEPEMIHPVSKKSMRALLTECLDHLKVIPL